MDNEPKVVARTTNPEPPVSTYLHAIAKKNNLPVSGTFELTGRCNFNCRMCYVHTADSNKLKSRELPAEWWIKTAEEAVSQGMMFLLLTGGEPLLREDFPLIYSELNKMGLVISINTNGYLLNGRIAELFKKMPPSRINISLYGASDEAYEKFTGTKGFSTVVENIELMRSMGIEVRLNGSITQDNCEDMENIFNLSRKLGLHMKTTSYMYPQVRINGTLGENSIRLSPEKAALCRVGWSKLKYSSEDFVSRAHGMLSKIAEHESSSEKNLPATKIPCRAGGTCFWIDKDGEMSPCGMLGKSFDVKTLGFSEAWKKVREFTDSIVLPQKCSNCKLRHLCNVCAAVCYTETGSFSGVPEYVCRFTEETARLTQIELERLEKQNGD